MHGQRSELFSTQCNGCKICKACNKPETSKSKAKNCRKCGTQLSRVKDCEVKIYYCKVGNDRLVLVKGNHNHPNPSFRKLSKRETNCVKDVFNNNPTLTTSEVQKGIGIHKSPFLMSPALVNRDRIERIRRKVFEERYGKDELFITDIEKIQRERNPGNFFTKWRQLKISTAKKNTLTTSTCSNLSGESQLFC